MSSVQFDDLPPEIFQMITQYLSLEECVRLESVNTKWRYAMLKQWKRQKIVDVKDFISNDFLNNENNILFRIVQQITRLFMRRTVRMRAPILQSTNRRDLAIAISPLKTLAVKIHPYVETIVVDLSPWYPSMAIAEFFKKLSELSTPHLTCLHLRLSVGLHSGDIGFLQNSTSKNIAKYIPRDLNSLGLKIYGHNKAEKLFFVGLYQQTFTQMTNLSLELLEGDLCVRFDALKFPSLKKLHIHTYWLYSGDIVTDNFHLLTKLEELSLRSDVFKKVSRLLEAATSADCQFRQCLKRIKILDLLESKRGDAEILERIGHFTRLEYLELPICWFGLSEEMKLLHAIGQGCVSLKYFERKRQIQVDELTIIADTFHNLRTLTTSSLTLEKIERFCGRLSAARELEICTYDDQHLTVSQVQASGILNSFPNVRYRKLLTKS